MAKTALVISGGGSKGAFAVGALKYIQERVRPINTFDLYCGTSTGSLIVPLAATGELVLLEEQFTTLRQADILRLGSVLNLAVGISLHDATPLKNRIEAQLTPARYDRLRAPGAAPLFLATTCLQTERLVYWTTQAGAAATENYDVQPINNITDLRRAMLASACQPVFMQPVEVRPGTLPVRQYVDGSVREITPLQAAVDQGADTIVALTLSPRQTPAENQPLTQAIQILQRTVDMFGEDVGQNDYRFAQITQRGNAYLQSVRRRLLALGVAPGIVNDALAQPGSPFKNTALTTIHEIRPAAKLTEGGPGGLTFEPAAMRGMLQKGYAQAKAYFEALPGLVV